MEENTHSEWFCNWFNTPYYHILYKNRNISEAKNLIDHLLSKISLPAGGRIADIACGRGRHAVYLNKKGFDVTGIDISEASIEYAKKDENDTLHFAVHDMRRTFVTNYFDAVFNLFTSMGYFKTDRENEHAVKTMSLALKKNGVVIIDFFNAQTAVKNIVPQEEKNIEGILFSINKHIEKNILVKNISFDAEGKHYEFSEHVRMITLKDYERYFNETGLKILNLFGDYALNPFSPHQSERLIIVGLKK